MIKAKGEIIFKDWMQKLIKAILICSTPFLTILLSNWYDIIHILIGGILSLLISIILFVKIFNIEKVNIKKFLLINFVSLYMIKVFLLYSNNNIVLIEKVILKIFSVNLSISICKKLLGLLAIPITIFLVYLFVEKAIIIIKKFINSLTKIEKKYILIVLVISIILSISINVLTKAFSKPVYNNLVVYGAIYTSDSGFITNNNAYFNVSNPENDIRQPLFGIFSLPFSVPAKLISEVCFFLPNNYAYEILMTIIQFLLTAVSTIMIGRMLKLEEKDKIYLYLLFSLSFTYILFSLVLEQYVIGLFYLILAFYIYSQNKTKINYMYIGAVGTLITSGIIFPVIAKFKNIKSYINNTFKCFLAFVSILIIGGQFPQVMTIGSRVNALNNFIGDLTFYDKFCQFTFFVKGLFSPISGTEVFIDRPVYRMGDINCINYLGIIILITLTISLILNRKNKMAIISFLWVLFSFIILVLVGWGTAENGLVLYSLYFAWAYYILYFLLIKKMFKNKKIFYAIMFISVILMLIFNLQEFSNILKFALKYY